MRTTLQADRIEAVLCDVDGTLYDQKPLRRSMIGQLARLPLGPGGLRGARRTFRAIGAFRHTLEALRDRPPGTGLREARFTEAAARAEIPIDEMRAIVTEWIYERPLARLASCARPGMKEFVRAARTSGRQVGVLSDYPTSAKLEALGVAPHVRLRLCCDDPDIDAFKPLPHGFLRAAQIWGLPPERVLYVGDRPSVDAAGAMAAGMPCAIVGRRGRRLFGGGFVGAVGFHRLARVLGLSMAH